MPLIPLPKPNIDEKGRQVRLILGLVCMMGGTLCAGMWALPSGLKVAWLVSLGLFAIGCLCVLEAAMGWCVARACGIRTKV